MKKNEMLLKNSWSLTAIVVIFILISFGVLVFLIGCLVCSDLCIRKRFPLNGTGLHSPSWNFYMKIINHYTTNCCHTLYLVSSQITKPYFCKLFFLECLHHLKFKISSSTKVIKFYVPTEALDFRLKIKKKYRY